jgi:protein ImuA
MLGLVKMPVTGAPAVRARVAEDGRNAEHELSLSTVSVASATSVVSAAADVATVAVGRPRNPRLALLAEQISHLQARWRPATTPHCPTGVPALDAVLDGGFAAAAIHELVGVGEGAAVHTVALRAAAHAAGRHKWIFYIDTQHDLYPPALISLGVPLGRLIVVRTACTADALWVCEQTLRCRAVAAVVLPLRSADTRATRRLQLAAEAGGGLGLLLCRETGGGTTFAASRLRFEPLSGVPDARALRVTVLKLREGRLREPFVVEVRDAADSVPAHAVPADRAGTARRRVGG